MFHAFDSSGSGEPVARRDWMAVLARAPVQMLESALADWSRQEPGWLRRPETGLMMVQGRAGGTGERFNLGEVTVTRCALRVDGRDEAAPVGVAWVLGRNARQCRLAAIADALLQDPACRAQIEGALIEPVRRHLAAQHAQAHARSQSTRVDFFTVARESSAPDEGDEE